jgi:type I restriction enzyme S subunit
MASIWHDTTFDSILTGRIRHGLYKPLNAFGAGTRVLKMGLQYAEERIGDQPMPRVPLSPEEIERYKVREGDLLFSRTSMMSEGAGKCSLAVKHLEPFVFDGNVLCATVDRTIAEPGFYYYYFGSPRGRQAISEIIAGTQSRSLSGSSLSHVIVPIPPVADQQRIAHVLGTLDDKIELNRRMNETLEATARALFEKLKNKSKASKKLDELAEINSQTLSKTDELDPIEYIEISEVSRGNIGNIQIFERGKEPTRARRKLRHGDTVLSTVRPDRRSYFLCLNPSPNLIASTGFAVVSPINAAWSFVHAALTQEEVFDYLGQQADGGAYPAIRPQTIGKLEVPWPGESGVEKFHHFCGRLYERAEYNRRESRTLAALRDALLPKLLSGEIEPKKMKTR